jgi:hypothetical protein
LGAGGGEACDEGCVEVGDRAQREGTDGDGADLETGEGVIEIGWGVGFEFDEGDGTGGGR